MAKRVPWSGILHGYDEPVLGRVSDYERAEREFRRLKTAATDIHTEFGRITSGREIGEIKGQAANQLATLVGGIDSALDHLAPVLSQVETLFRKHAEDLEDLHKKAGDALDLANTRWNTYNAEVSNAASEIETLNWIDTQIENLQYSTETVEEVDAERDRLEGQRWTQQLAVNSAVSKRTAASEELELSKTAHKNLAEDEDGIIDATVKGFDNLDMTGLEDGNALLEAAGAIIGGAGNMVGAVLEGVFELADALLDGRFMDAVWMLSDLLGEILDVVAVVLLAIAAIALIVGTGGAAAPLLGLLVIGGVKLGADALLAGTQHPHPHTGETKTWGEVMVDAVFLAIDAYTFHLSRKLGPLKRTLSENVKQAINPVVLYGKPGNLGKPIYGAAKEASRKRSLQEAFFDHTTQDLIEKAKDGAEGSFDTGGLSPDADVWTNDRGLVEFMQDAPASSAIESRVDNAVSSVREFRAHGPLTDDGVAVYQLAAA